MLSKILIIMGLIVIFLIPRMMRYHDDTQTVAGNLSTISTMAEEKSTTRFKVPKTTPWVDLNHNYYNDHKLEPFENNLLLTSSSLLILTGIGLMEIETMTFLIKNKIKFNFRELWVNVFKII